MLKKTGTHLHESAAFHARTLGKTLDKYTVDAEAMREFLARPNAPSCVVHESSPPTRVLDMDVDDDLIAGLKRELAMRARIDDAIAQLDVVPDAMQYTPLSTHFENAVFFLPSAQRFYDRNKEAIHSTFPQIETAVVNAFIVPANKRPYGVHNAASIGLQVARLAQRGMAYPTTYVSFHCALTPTPLERQPLVIWEDAEVESPNTPYLWEQIRSYDMDPEEAAAVDKAFYLHDANKLSEFDLPSIGHYLLCKYYEKKYSRNPERSSGYYHPCKPGQAVVFDNYRAHGDSTLPASPETRLTIDVRCFSKVKYPSDTMSGGIDFVLNPERKKRERQRKAAALECLLLLVGYKSIDEFFERVYGDTSIDPFQITTDLQFSVYNKTPHYILDQDLEPHFEKVNETYDRIDRDGEFAIPDRARDAIANLYSL
jgi:hypothetical protein